MSGWRIAAEEALRGRGGEKGEVRAGRSKLVMLGVMGVGLAGLYGATMGTFPDESGGVRPWQMLFSAIKVPMLLVVTFLVALPSFFVLNTLLGVRDDFGEVMRALGNTQAVVTLVLASLAPVTLFWYVSTTEYDWALVWNGVMFLVASLAGQVALVRSYKPLIARNRVHRRLLLAWLVLFTFVGIQLGWVLRPFVGSPGAPTQFFRSGAWGNAYVEVWQIVWRAIGGG